MKVSMDTEHENDHYDVFISHRSIHKPWVITLANNLCQRSYKVWLDAWQLVPGRNFLEGLHRGLKNSRKAILVATPDSVESGWVREEYETMLNRKQRDPGFSFVPLVFGAFPDLPFLENVHCVDFRDPSPKAYCRAFYHLLCGLEDRAPGPESELEGDLEIPEPIGQVPQPVQGSEQAFLGKVCEILASSQQPLLLLAQADRGQGDIIQAILEQAQRRFRKANALHVTPPYSHEADVKDYFARLGRQCRFAESISSSLQWEDALDRRLEQGERLFLLVSGFENGSEAGRRELAGVLRGLNERHANRLKIVLCGGERLAELKYGPAHLSLLNNAEVLEWPEPTVADVLAWQARDFFEVSLDEDEAQALLNLCGGHPRLMRYCLQQRRQQPGLAEDGWQQALEDYPFVSELFIHHRENPDVRKRICGWLAKSDLGDFEYWPADPLLRQLYWNNLLARRNRWFVWRCEILREAGRRVLRCGE